MPHDARTPPAPARPDHSGGVNATWIYTLGSIVFVVVVLAACILLPTAQSFVSSPRALYLALIVLMLAAAATQVRYCWFLRRGLAGGLPHFGWTVALLAPAAAAWLLGLFAPDIGATAAFPLWMALCILACLLLKRPRWMLLAFGVALVALHAYLGSLPTGVPVDFLARDGAWLLICYGVMLPLMLLSGLWWWQIVVELDQHRRIAAELAVARERLRFAADLHDIQGHHLQVIALKSELAERLLDLDIEAARANIHETRLIAKQALEEIRSLVHGYREIALDEEIENAREVLSAAGAKCELDLVDLFPAEDAGATAIAGADARRALAMAVREATTNIVRHSTASDASIRLRLDGQLCVLEVANNGVSGASAGPAEPSRIPSSGLAGLRARMVEQGGGLETRLDAENGTFALRAWVPASRHSTPALQGPQS